jgi:hypothetical protein
MSQLLRVLIIEDSEDDAALMVRELNHGGYDVAFERVDTPAGLLGTFEREWDLVLCDHRPQSVSVPWADFPLYFRVGRHGQDDGGYRSSEKCPSLRNEGRS